MNDDKCVIVAGVRYVPEQKATGDIKIVVLQRGNVVVGRLSQKDEMCELAGASVIRTWGTKKGLGEIAYEGPIENKTILDRCPNISFHVLTSVMIMDCVEESWENHCR
jgi:hypothetical protein